MDGLAETRAVFLDGCGLPEAWAGRPHFTVGELGFGTGLNIAGPARALGARRGRRADGLHIFSVEAYPISRDEAARALAAWPELAELAAGCWPAWPGRRAAAIAIDLPELGATLDLAVDGGRPTPWPTGAAEADAWFLDGFAPPKNPRDVARRGPGPGRAPARARRARWPPSPSPARSARGPGGARLRASTRARASAARSERLEARLPGAAGAREAAAAGGGDRGGDRRGGPGPRLPRLGVEPTVVERRRAGAGASGNPAALVTPRLDAGLGAVARLLAQAFGSAPSTSIEPKRPRR